MIRYINNRYTEIELVLNSETGLKIPNSAITSKEFFKVPISYFTLGADSNDPCLLIKSDKDDGQVKLVTPTIYFETEDYYYIDSEDVNEGDVVMLNDSSSTYTIGTDKEALTGVYNINKGYAVFKQISIISQNDESFYIPSGSNIHHVLNILPADQHNIVPFHFSFHLNSSYKFSYKRIL